MEPSLRSSAVKGIDCKLRKPDPSLHETTQRFVESLLGDIRISQFADMNYAATIMKAGKWMFLDALDGGRVGFLVMTPNSPIVWMDDRGKTAYIIPMRIKSSLCDKGSIAIASLNKAEGTLRIEDMKILAGQDIRGLSFTRRWEHLLEFYRTSYVFDSALQRDLRIQTAVYKPIESIQSWADPPEYIFAQNDTMPRRLRIQLKEKELDLSKNLLVADESVRKPSVHAPLQKQSVQMPAQKQAVHAPVQKPAQKPPVQMPAQKPRPSAKEPSAKEPAAKQPAQTIAVPEEFPDTYTIVINGETKGYAAVQDIELSRRLRLAAKDSKKSPVKVEWNQEFSSYEIISLL